MFSAEVAKYRRQQQKYGTEPKTYDELKALIDITLNPPLKKRTWTKHKDRDTCNYKAYPVQVFTVEGKFIGEYPSRSQAGEATHVHPSQVIKSIKNGTPAKGYMFFNSDQDNTVNQD